MNCGNCGHCRAFDLLILCIPTFRQVIYVNKGMICGQWEVKWSHTWSDFEKKPYICDGKLEFLFKVNLKFSYRACFYSIVNFYLLYNIYLMRPEINVIRTKGGMGVTYSWVVRIVVFLGISNWGNVKKMLELKLFRTYRGLSYQISNNVRRKLKFIAEISFRIFLLRLICSILLFISVKGCMDCKVV